MLSALGLILSVMMFFGAGWSVGLFLEEGENLSLEYGMSYLRMISFFYVFNYIGSVLMGWFRGAGHVVVPITVAALHITLRVLLSWLWVRDMGPRGIALAEVCPLLEITAETAAGQMLELD